VPLRASPIDITLNGTNSFLRRTMHVPDLTSVDLSKLMADVILGDISPGSNFPNVILKPIWLREQHLRV